MASKSLCSCWCPTCSLVDVGLGVANFPWQITPVLTEDPCTAPGFAATKLQTDNPHSPNPRRLQSGPNSPHTQKDYTLACEAQCRGGSRNHGFAGSFHIHIDIYIRTYFCIHIHIPAVCMGLRSCGPLQQAAGKDCLPSGLHSTRRCEPQEEGRSS